MKKSDIYDKLNFTDKSNLTLSQLQSMVVEQMRFLTTASGLLSDFCWNLLSISMILYI